MSLQTINSKYMCMIGNKLIGDPGLDMKLPIVADSSYAATILEPYQNEI